MKTADVCCVCGGPGADWKDADDLFCQSCVSIRGGYAQLIRPALASQLPNKAVQTVLKELDAMLRYRQGG